MNLITRNSLAAQAAARWHENYFSQRTGEWLPSRVKDAKAIFHRLEALGPNPPPAEVDAIIGNDAWTHFRCHECGLYNQEGGAVELGEPPDYESNTATICLECLRKALCLFPILNPPG